MRAVKIYLISRMFTEFGLQKEQSYSLKHIQSNKVILNKTNILLNFVAAGILYFVR